MADSDSDPFESADEGENESKNASKTDDLKDDKEVPSVEKSNDQEDSKEAKKDEVQEMEQKDVKSDENQKTVDAAKDEDVDERTDKEPSTQENNKTEPPQQSEEALLPQTSDEKSSSSTADNGALDSKDAGDEALKISAEDKTYQEGSKASDQEGSKVPNQEGPKVPEQEGPKAPEEQSIAGSLDRLAGAIAGESTEKVEKQESKSSAGGWGGWGGWGSSLLSSATSKVSEMGHGLSHVIENVENTLGVPKPEDLPAEPMKVESDDFKEGEGPPVEKPGPSQEQQKTETSESNEAGGQSAQSPGYLGGWFTYGASALTNVVEKTVTGGLDALELIGKKTMDVLQEGDPGFRKKRAYISEKTGQSINLSQMLREAKESAEMASQAEEQQKEMEKVHFGILFDNYQGLAHLEALEMLSNQSEMKVQSLLASLSGDQLSAIQTELDEIKDAFQIEDLESDEIDESIDEQDFVNIITEHLFGVCVAATPDKLQKVQKAAHEWLVECQKAQEEGEKKDPKELHIKAIETLAELSARSIEQFHKSSELMLLHQDKDQHKSCIMRATSLSKLTSTLCAELSSLAGKFCERLNVIANDADTENASETVNPIITNIYLEASNSSSYVQDAFQLLLPVLQTLALENCIEESKTQQDQAS